MELEQAIRSRRTIRRFQQRQVETDQLRKLIDAARMASCGGNQQPLRYMVIQEPALVGELFDTTRWAALVQPARTPEPGKTAPLTFIAVIAEAALNPMAEAGAAIENLQLMACSIGLGCCWIGAYDHKAADRLLSLGDDRKSLFLVAVGYPGENPVSEDIGAEASPKYYLDANDVLHVPKFNVDAICEWR